MYNNQDIIDICHKIKPTGCITCGEWELIKNGIETNINTELVNNENDADYVIYHGRNSWGWSKDFVNESKIKNPDKAIIIDYHDSPNHVFSDDAKYYFKRSLVDKTLNKVNKYNRNIYHIPYCVRPDFLKYTIDKKTNDERNIDVGIYFDTNNNHIVNRNRVKVAKFINNSKKLSKYNIHVGLVSQHGKEWRHFVNDKYINKLIDSKIIVTCNPSLWEGDYRLYEALISGAVVFVDEMKFKDGFADNENICFYDLNNLESLESKLIYYLSNSELLIKSMNKNIENTMTNHLSKNLIDRILKVIK